MTLAPLATTDDLDARTIAWDDQDLAETYLGVASASVRDAAGVPISRVTSTVSLFGDDGQWLRLPGPPVISVATVTLDGGALVQGTDWALVDGALFRVCGWRVCGPLPVPAVVTYTHGLAEVPADVVDLVCRLTASALVAAAAEDDGSGLAVDRIVSERLGDYAVTYDKASGATEMELADRTRDRLRSRFGGTGAAMVGTR
ncbi:hypothetical protein [Actinomadura rubrisoli]|uniref:Head-to-tail adaptor n=1 Tax=Actinomadura rubrisoli TaxID=2530368 RepID=A0A4V2YXC1_9ACTN|nr:hypothetical protein [Actinomadura rubrisoli]TDD88357.1 hypothetical protein E1298_15215 [Actinomadura rubrisoli]